jgi:hypothetical protein
VERVTVPEAAELMGVTQSAVRKRMQRGTIPWDKDGEGRIYVYVDPSETSPGTGKDRARDKATGQSRDELLEAYREQVDFLRRELERKDTLLMSLMQRIPELEAPQSLEKPQRRARKIRFGVVPRMSSRRPRSLPSGVGGESSLGWSSGCRPRSSLYWFFFISSSSTLFRAVIASRR